MNKNENKLKSRSGLLQKRENQIEEADNLDQYIKLHEHHSKMLKKNSDKSYDSYLKMIESKLSNQRALSVLPPPSTSHLLKSKNTSSSSVSISQSFYS